MRLRIEIEEKTGVHGERRIAIEVSDVDASHAVVEQLAQHALEEVRKELADVADR